jgi:hypothetical protein
MLAFYVPSELTLVIAFFMLVLISAFDTILELVQV